MANTPTSLREPSSCPLRAVETQTDVTDIGLQVLPLGSPGKLGSAVTTEMRVHVYGGVPPA